MTPEEIAARREARGMADPLNRLRARNVRRIAEGEEPITERPPCFCPDDCSCHYPHRATLCGCKGHA